MFKNKSNVNLHRHPSTDDTWFEIRYDIDECIVGIDGDWVAHVEKVILDFSGYRREFDASSLFETHTGSSAKGSPDVAVAEEALIATPEGLLVTWKKGGSEYFQLSKDLVHWHSLSMHEAISLLSRHSIDSMDRNSLSTSINRHCRRRSISLTQSVSQFASSPCLLEQFVEECAPDWQVNSVAPGFKTVSRLNQILFTITPLDIVYWRAVGEPELVTEHQAIAQIRSLIAII